MSEIYITALAILVINTKWYVMTDSEAKVGVLSFHNSKETKAILNCLDEMGHQPVWLRGRNLEIRMGSNSVDMTPDVDIVINRLLLSTEERPAELVGVASAVADCVPILNHPSNVMVALNKIASTSRLSTVENAGIPDSLFSSSVALESYIDENGESVLKNAIGTHGDGTKLVDESDTIFSGMQGSPYSIVQERVEQEKVSDVRVYVVGGEIVSSMERVPAEGEWRANIAQGGSADEVNLSEEIRDKILEVTNGFNLDYAGVDLIDGEDGWMFLEVNPTAGFKGLYNATGTSPAPHICALALEKIDEKVDYKEVEELSRELDDSIPDCYPNRRVVSEKPILGLETKTIVGGRKQTEEVVAKVDTGADRTSIDTKLAAKIGVGPIDGYTEVKTGSKTDKRVRPLANVNISVKDIKHTVKVSIEDRSNLSNDVILGRDILSMYKIDPTKGIEE